MIRAGFGAIHLQVGTDPWTPPRAEPAPRPRRPKKGTAAYEEWLDRLRTTPAIRCLECGYEGPTFRRREGLQPWHLALVVIGFGLLLILMAATATRPCCPSCLGLDTFEPYDGPFTPEAVALHARVQAEHDRRAKISTRVVLGLVLAVALALLGWVVLRPR